MNKQHGNAQCADLKCSDTGKKFNNQMWKSNLNFKRFQNTNAKGDVKEAWWKA